VCSPAADARPAAHQASPLGSLGYTRDDFAEHLRTGFSTFRWLFEPMLTSAALDIVTAAFDGQIYGAYTCIKA
jgi:hypothetical protein